CLILAFALAFLLIAILCQSRKYRFISFILFLAINLRTNLIFLSAQPDGAAALLAVLGLYLWATRSNFWQRAVYSIPFFLCATLFKQTGAAFALFPIFYLLIWKR